MVMSLVLNDAVAVITWDDGENRINRDSLARLHELLDELEAVSGPLAVVLTGAGKFFSNGLDLARFGADPEEFLATLQELHRTVARLVNFPAYTVAAINGHAFAGGALISCALDYRVMREDRGYWCMNEADIGLVLDERLASILFNRLPRATAINAMLTAHRYGASEAKSAGIVEATSSEGELLSDAIAIASGMATKDRGAIAAHKRLAYRSFVASLGFPLA